MKVIIAIDDSQCSVDAVSSAIESAWPPETEIRILTVVEPCFGSYLGDLVDQAEREFVSHCKQAVVDKVEQFKLARADVSVAGVVRNGKVAESVIQEAIEFKADLIIVGSHGHRGFDKLLLGSVAEKLATCAPCSVEIARPKTEKVS